MLEMAWLWLRHQPRTALSQWFNERIAQSGGRFKKVKITALARKLVVALWKYVTAGVIIEGVGLAHDTFIGYQFGRGLISPAGIRWATGSRPGQHAVIENGIVLLSLVVESGIMVQLTVRRPDVRLIRDQRGSGMGSDLWLVMQGPILNSSAGRTAESQ